MYEIREYVEKMDYLFCETCQRRIDEDYCHGEPVKKTEYRMLVVEARTVDDLEEALKKIEAGETEGQENLSQDDGWRPTGKHRIHICADGHDRAQAIEYLKQGLSDIKHGGDYCSMHDPDIDPSIPALYYSCSGQGYKHAKP
jgi:hypothetical protein